MNSTTDKLQNDLQSLCIDMIRQPGKSKKIFDSLMKNDEKKKRGKREDKVSEAEKVFMGHAYGKSPSQLKASKKK